MAEVTLYGVPLSTYVRSARLALAEKGVAYDLVPHLPGSPEMAGLHPFGKVPVLAHDGFRVYETGAICAYVDEAFAGPALRPAGARERARMEQWVSAYNAYLYATLVRDIVIERVLVPRRGGTPDEARIAAAAERGAGYLALIEADLAATGWLAGDAPSIADLMLAPAVHYLHAVPEGGVLLGDRPRLAEWYARIAARPSFAATEPGPMPE